MCHIFFSLKIFLLRMFPIKVTEAFGYLCSIGNPSACLSPNSANSCVLSQLCIQAYTQSKPSP